MKVHTNSWHHRLQEYAYGEDYFRNYDGSHKQIALCPYFWGTVLSIILAPIVFVGSRISDKLDERNLKKRREYLRKYNAGLIKRKKQYISDDMKIVILIASVAIPIGAAIIGGLITNFDTTIKILASVGLVAGMYAAAIFGISRLVDWLKHRPKKEREPNMLIEYIKARKHKVCPFLDIVEDE